MAKTLATINATRNSDPTFQKQVSELIEAEATLAGKDPAEGLVIPDGHGLGPAQTTIRDLLKRA